MTPATAGSAAEQKAYSAEVGVAWVRFAVIAFNIPVYWLAIAPQGIRWLAVTISVVAGLYAVVIVGLRPYERFPAMTTAAWTAVTDSSLIVLWIQATGGYDSPFYLLWYLSLFAITFRYNAMATWLASLLYAGLYTTQLGLAGTLLPHLVQVGIRDAYILLVGALGGVLARSSLQVFQERFLLGQRVQETERFRALAEANPEAIAIVREETIIEANQPFCDLLGRPRLEVVQRPIEAIATPEQLALVRDHMKDPSRLRDHAYTRPDGTPLVLRASGRPIQYQGAPALFVSVRDVTQERAAEEARRAALEAELEVKRLKQVDRFKTDFINTAAHELSTPLTPIKIQLHRLQARLANAPPEERRALEIVARNLERLAALVQDMLDVARLQSGRLSIQAEATDLAQLVRDAVDTFALSSDDTGVALSAEVPARLPCIADGKRITQVLFNLLSNALKFTPRGGRVHIAVRALAGRLEVSVQDTGVGLSADQAARLFQPFAQVHRDQVDVPGTGLGLYISRGILERHGGGIEVWSPGPGQGSTFRFWIPQPT